MNFDKSTQIMRFNKIDNYCPYRFFFNQLVVVVESADFQVVILWDHESEFSNCKNNLWISERTTTFTLSLWFPNPKAHIVEWKLVPFNF